MLKEREEEEGKRRATKVVLNSASTPSLVFDLQTTSIDKLFISQTVLDQHLYTPTYPSTYFLPLSSSSSDDHTYIFLLSTTFPLPTLY